MIIVCGLAFQIDIFTQCHGICIFCEYWWIPTADIMFIFRYYSLKWNHIVFETLDCLVDVNNGCFQLYIDGLVQYCSVSIANALGILQSCTEPTTCFCDSSYVITCIRHNRYSASHTRKKYENIDDIRTLKGHVYLYDINVDSTLCMQTHVYGSSEALEKPI